MLHVSVRHPFGRITLDITFEAGAGLTALLGPSGAGKTSVLNIIAGLHRPAHAEIRMGETVLADTARNIWVPAHQRRIGYVFQDVRLFPHLSVKHNLTYATWATTHTRRATPPITLESVVGMLDLGALLSRNPARLSGGEKQRVAIGRALLSDPALLLLDEPLAAVDVARRQEVLPYLDRMRVEVGLPVIYVTHAWPEVETRAERVIHIDEGRLVALRP